MNNPYNFIEDFDNWWYWQVCVIYWKTSKNWATTVVSNRNDWKPVYNPSSGGLQKIRK